MNRGRAAAYAVRLTVALTVTALATAGAASASSPPNVTGQKYSDASTALSDAGFTPVVSTTVGDRKQWPDCLVSNTVARTVAPPPDSSGAPVNEALVSLNCYSAEASAKGAGYSAASPEGRKIAADEAAAAKAAQAEQAKQPKQAKSG